MTTEQLSDGGVDCARFWHVQIVFGCKLALNTIDSMTNYTTVYRLNGAKHK